MIYIDNYTSQEWTRKHGVVITMAVCKNCNECYSVNVPIRIKGYAGFEMEKHGCPDNYLAAVFTPVDENEKRFWSEII